MLLLFDFRFFLTKHDRQIQSWRNEGSRGLTSAVVANRVIATTLGTGLTKEQLNVRRTAFDWIQL